jgi:hypothetical protein
LIAVRGNSVKSEAVLSSLLTETEVMVTVLEPADIPRPKVTLERKSTDQSFGFAVKSASHVPGAFVTQVCHPLVSLLHTDIRSFTLMHL